MQSEHIDIKGIFNDCDSFQIYLSRNSSDRPIQSQDSFGNIIDNA